MTDLDDRQFLQQAVTLAVESVGQGGGPFGALVVKNGKIIGQGTNCVTRNNDPTAHAEVQAIRMACEQIKDFSLEGATLYASCEPCPMCLSASYWARIERIVYAADEKQAAEAGFDDSFISDELRTPHSKKKIQMQGLGIDASAPFEKWKETEKKTLY